MSIEIMNKKSNIIKDIDIFQTSLFVSKRLSSGAIEAYYSQKECNQHHDRFFEINSSALLNDELLIIDTHTYKVENKFTVCAKNEDVAKAIYYLTFLTPNS
ncbi:MAG: hypothetical protein U9N42_03405 [Campylobacterota bacterium]|nr:hypothetical protein [Campylobacterota bacterium]